jgi:hypothetical protein
MIVRCSLSTILAALCLLHLYWAFGGKWALDKVNPQVDGKPLLKLGFIACFGAAIGFFILAAVPVVSMKPALRKWLLIGMAVVFAGRAIGDFKNVGFFKSVKGTAFALWDTRVYSPLNVLIAVLAGLSLR